MPRIIRKKARQYVLDRFQEEDPESYFKYKMQSGLNEDQMELLQAINNQSVQLVKAHLNKGIDPNFTAMSDHMTPLHIAVKSYVRQNTASEKILRALLFFGANTEAIDKQGNTPMHQACLCYSYESVQLLTQAGADLNSLNSTEETPLMVTCRLAKTESFPIVDFLLNSGALPFITDSKGRTALHILSASAAYIPCYESMRHEIAILLMKHGLSADDQDKTGKTPLSYEIKQMTRATSNATLIFDLMKEGSSLCTVVDTAICLVQGGAMHTLVPQKELEALIHTMPVHPHSLSIIRTFLISISPYVPASILKRINRMLDAVSDRSTLIVALQSAVGLLCPTVPSLAELAKISVRDSLKGNVFQNVEALAVPEKIKFYIKGGD